MVILNMEESSNCKPHLNAGADTKAVAKIPSSAQPPPWFAIVLRPLEEPLLGSKCP